MTTLTAIERDSLRDDLYEAQDHLNQAIDLIENYVRRTGDGMAEAYILDHLRIFSSSNHGFISDDMNIDDLITGLDELETDADEDNKDTEDGSPTPTMITSTGRTLYWCASAGRYVSVPED